MADEKKTVRVRRRRRSEPAESGERKRADAPRRRRSDSQDRTPPRPPGGTGGGFRPPPASSGKPFPGGGAKLPLPVIGILIVLAICAFIFMSFFGSDDSGDVANNSFPTATAVSLQPAAQNTPTRPPVAFTPPVNTSSEGQTWLIMLYQDADDKVLEQDIYVDLNEAERIGSNDQVHIVSQVDRFSAGYQGDGNWSSTKRFYVTQDDDLQRVNSQEVADLGEVNMADSETLVDFVTWAIETFPADKHVLIMSDHGLGWPGGWSDPDPPGPVDRSIPLSSVLGDELYLMEIDDALAEIRSKTGLEKFELIGMDACLMGHLEVFSALAPHARYAVASQETEPALGWAYTGFLEPLVANPTMNGADLSRLIVNSYIYDDQRIVDDEARADMLRQSSPLSGFFGGGVSAEQLARQMDQSITLSAVDLAALPTLTDSVNNLSFNLQQENQSIVARARSYAQSFTSIFGNNVPPSYIDLGHFAQLLHRETRNPNVAQAAEGVLAALNTTVIAEKHGPKKSGSTGVSIYFPNSPTLPIACYRASILHSSRSPLCR